MRLLELHLKAFGPFTDCLIPLGGANQRLVLVHGMNEAGKSSALRAITALRFGFPERTTDDFIHDYPSLRVGGVFVDAEGTQYSLMRRKGRSVTLKFVDFTRGGTELPDPVPSGVVGLLTTGLRAEEYETMFGLDHARLRAGGAALERGDGELGAALFEASTGVVDVAAILTRLNDVGREYYNPAAQSRNAKFNLALTEYRQQSERHRGLTVRPTKWEQLQRAWGDAKQALDSLTGTHRTSLARQIAVKELIAVSPTLGELARCDQGLSELESVRILDVNASTERSTAAAGHTDALVDAQSFEESAREAQGRFDAIVVDDAVLSVEDAITTLRAAANVIDGHIGQEAQAQADIDERAAAVAAAARMIAASKSPEELEMLAPSASTRARLTEYVNALSRAQQALEMHEESSAAGTQSSAAHQIVPDGVAVSALRQAVDLCTRQAQTLDRTRTLKQEILQAEREVNTALASLGLDDEQAARNVVPLLGAAVDQVTNRLASIAAARIEKHARVDEMTEELGRQNETIAGLTEHGDVPTMDDVHSSRVHRQQGWKLVRAIYIDKGQVDTSEFAQGKPLDVAFEHAVSQADGVVDGIVGDYDRASKLSAARRKVAELNRDVDARNREIDALGKDQGKEENGWASVLARAAIPHMATALVRDWQISHAECLTKLNAVQSKSGELQEIEDLRAELRNLMCGAINRVGLAEVREDESLGTLQAIAQDGLREVAERVKARDTAVGQEQQRSLQLQQHEAKSTELTVAAESARSKLDELAPAVLVARGESTAVYRARLAEFDALSAAAQSLSEARRRLTAASKSLENYAGQAQGIAAAIGEPEPTYLNVASEQWRARLGKAKQDLAELKTAATDQENAAKQAAECVAKAKRHEATLARLCLEAGVESPEQLPEVEEQSARKRTLLAAKDTAGALLAKASRRSRDELETLRAGRDADTLHAEEADVETELAELDLRLPPARTTEEEARHALDEIDASDEAAEAADAMSRAAASMRNTLSLQMRYRLAHALLHEAMRRFKQRTQAPMLRRASEYFAQITGGAFEGLSSDDSEAKPVIVGKRPGGEAINVAAMSEGTRDQLYLALRLAALDLQRDRGVDLPLVLDDVLMTSDDERAGCILQALAAFSRRGQVIVFTHHDHLCDIARAAVPADQLAVTPLLRAPLLRTDLNVSHVAAKLDA